MFKQLSMILLLIAAIIFTVSCSKGKEYNEDKLVQIYAAVELSPIGKSKELIKKYGLDDETKRQAYYQALREYSTNQDKWEAFLEKVEKFRKKK